MNEKTLAYINSVKNSGQASKFQRDREADAKVKSGRNFSTLQSKPTEMEGSLLGAALGVYNAN